MKQSVEMEQRHRLWIDLTERILSFHEVNNDQYQLLEFSNEKEKMAFALQKSVNGFRVQ